MSGKEIAIILLWFINKIRPCLIGMGEQRINRIMQAE